MNDVDKRLEELAGNPNPLKDDIAGLAAALLRAREALRYYASPQQVNFSDEVADAALADPELEELLR